MWINPKKLEVRTTFTESSETDCVFVVDGREIVSYDHYWWGSMTIDINSVKHALSSNTHISLGSRVYEVEQVEKVFQRVTASQRPKECIFYKGKAIRVLNYGKTEEQVAVMDIYVKNTQPIDDNKE